MEKKYTIIFHHRCGWVSPPMDNKALGEFGVPWYCGSCGEQVVRFAKGTLQELNEWKKDHFALKEGKCETERLREELKFTDEVRQSALQSLFAAEKEIERLRGLLNADNQTLRLHFGELTLNEMRIVKAAFQWVLIRA